MAVSSLLNCASSVAKIEPQQGPHGSTPWKIGEGYMHLDRVYLARLESVSKGSWQPELWVVDPTMPLA